MLVGLLVAGAFVPVIAQTYHFQLANTLIDGRLSPFWLHQGSRGVYLSEPYNLHVSTGIYSDYRDTTRLVEVGYGANAVFRASVNKSDLFFDELYVKARLMNLEVIAGNRTTMMDIEYEPLSSGGILFSGNSRNIPGITVCVDRFTAVPFTRNLLYFRGGLTHGWFPDSYAYKNILLHHKYFHVLLGKPLPVRLHARLDHVAQWGGTATLSGFPNHPASLRDYISIFLARSGGSGAIQPDQVNVLGGHIISQSLKLEADAGDWQLTAYWQNLLEDNPVKLIGLTMNRFDGLWGVTLAHRKSKWIRTLLYEFVDLTGQSGPYHDRDGIVYGGADDYFTTFYTEGWSYKSNTIGTPFVTSPVYNTTDYRQTINNRVRAHHFGLEGGHGRISYRLKASFTTNYGRYKVPLPAASGEVQRYYLLDVNYNLPDALTLAASVGVDRGSFTGNATGVRISIRKSGLLERRK